MKILINIGFTVFLFSTSVIVAQPLRFVKEEIQITVNKDFCELTGTYYFESPANQKIARTIFYPFPVKQNLPFPDSILVTIPALDKVLSYQKGKYGIYFRLSVTDTTVLQIYYRQPTPKREMVYILTSTAEWNMPLEETSIVLYLPDYFEIESTSYHWNKMDRIDNYKVYSIYKTNFMPDKDLHFSWARSKK